MRFRFQMILQRYNVYQTHWQRICREIENGTYKRHLWKAERRFGDEGPKRRRRSTLPPPGPAPSRDLAKDLAELDAEFAPPPPQEAQLDGADLMLEEEPSRVSATPAIAVPRPDAVPVPAQVQARKGPVWRKAQPPALPRHPSPPPPRPGAPKAQPIPAAPKVPAAAPGPPRAPAPPIAPALAPARASVPAPRPAPAPSPRATNEDLPEARVRQIYSQYVEAKRRGNESTAAITYEAVAKSLRESSAKLREKTGKAVDFEVATKDGKAILKPVIK
jgi:hypothetical protein